ncbi:putative holin-like toxin [Tuberibacillus sp. Marseille-P3662]
MTVYHTMNLMISFGLLVATVIAVSQKKEIDPCII